MLLGSCFVFLFIFSLEAPVSMTMTSIALYSMYNERMMCNEHSNVWVLDPTGKIWRKAVIITSLSSATNEISQEHKQSFSVSNVTEADCREKQPAANLRAVIWIMPNCACTTKPLAIHSNENSLLVFLQLENYIQDSMKQDLVQIQQTAVHNHTATMIEIGTNLLSQTAEQTRKLTNVEAQVRLRCLLL